MADFEERKPGQLPEVDVPEGALELPPLDDEPNLGGYQSSEQIQRKNRDAVFKADEEKQAKAQARQLTTKQKTFALLDKYIADHSNTKTVRDMAKKNENTADYQLDLSADIVTILEKIKKELGK